MLRLCQSLHFMYKFNFVCIFEGIRIQTIMKNYKDFFSLVINPQKGQECVLDRVRFDFMLTLKLTKIAKQPWSIFGQESSKTRGTLCHS